MYWGRVDRIRRKLSRVNQRLGVYQPRIEEFCFIIGAMKSGTTTLYSYLVQHPVIARNHFQKEPEFFSRREAPKDLRPYYRQWLPKPFQRQIALEASTGYMKRPSFPNVAERVKALPGRKHFVAILRDPVDRIESHLAHNTAAAGLPSSGERADRVHALAVSRYAMQLDAYRAAFAGAPLKIVLFEQFREDPIAVLRDICQHLEIDADFPFRILPPQNTRSRDAQAQSVRLSSEIRAELAAELAPDMARLRDEYGVDISRWGFA